MRRIPLAALLLTLLAVDSPASGDGGASLASSQPGSWTLLPNGPRAGFAGRHDDLDFIDANTGWVVNGDGDVWRTTNGGDSWSLLAYTGAHNRCVGFADAQNGWIGNLYQVSDECLLRTTNGGSNWTRVVLPEPKPAGLCGLQVVDANTICAVGAYYGTPRFVRSDDGGTSWTVTDMSAHAGALVDTWWFDDLNGVAVGSTYPDEFRHTRILTTDDGGANWSVRWTGTRDNELCWKISFVDRNIGFVSIENLNGVGAAYFLKTRDGGLTWAEHLFSPDYLDCQGIGFVSEYYGWIGGWGIGTYVTKDGGDEWTWKNFGYNVNRIEFLSPFLGYACGRDVYKYTANPSAVGDRPAPDVSARLSHARPNPFAGRTTISYRVSEPGRIRLRVFDVQGRPVRELVNAELAAGDYSVPFDAHGLAAGSYYYELRTPAGAETGKLQLVP